MEESKKFIDWLYTSDAGKETVLNDFKFIPAYEGYDSSKISHPLSKAAYEYAEQGKQNWFGHSWVINWMGSMSRAYKFRSTLATKQAGKKL